MAIGTRHDIDLPLHEARDTAMLLDVARPIPASELLRDGVNRFAAGVEWSLWPAIEHNLDPVECDTVYDKQPAEFDDTLPDQPAFAVWERLAVGSRCSSERAGQYLQASFTDFLSPTFASELETGAGSNGIGLVGNVSYPPTIVASTAVSLDVALARLENYLAQDSGFPGMRGVIHLTPALFNFAVATDLVTKVGDGFRTHTGHVVVGDAGHTGQATPQGGSAVSTDEAWIYATGDIWYAVSDLKGVMEMGGPDGGSFYVPRNEDRPLAELYGLIVFDPTVLAAAKVTVAMPGGGTSSGGGGGGGDASAANQTTMITALNTLLTNLGDADVNLEALEALMTTLNSQTNDLEAPLATAASALQDIQDALTADGATVTAVNDQDTNVNILGANASRRGVIIHNNSVGVLYIKYGATATATPGGYSYKIPADGTWEMPGPVYQGQIDGIWVGATTGAASITDLT